MNGKTISIIAKGKESLKMAPDISEVSKMENGMVMDTSFFLVDKSSKVNMKMVRSTGKVHYGLRVETSLQASLEMISIFTEKRFGKVEDGTKASGKIKNTMDMGFILKIMVQYTMAILWMTSFKAKEN